MAQLKTLLLVLFVLLTVVQVAFGECSNNLTDTKAKYFNLPQCCVDSRDRHSGIQIIQPQPGFGEPFGVYCDQDYEGGGWTVIQNRFDGSVNFYRGWKQYEDGFGSMEGEFWLGLKKIHELTYSKKYELVVLMDDWEGYRAVARYSRFSLAGPEENYTLKSVGNYSGTAGDSLSVQVGMKFSTLDVDNDTHEDGSCAVMYQGAWWYAVCHQSNLNGAYMKGTVPDFAVMMCWKSFKGYYYGLKTSRMMIRAVK
ncbi:fibrinogen C domain-containing protein 1-like [Culex quinquefasciatus]|uniref:fibrinogen C domain-containing protein 1-like n=1 Tax=Culex quinquefasciatus TaxID=7176 RepID=UPI0018E2B7AF|nr:fibrinogen C domain-containing protein 1-like [Culex quinquefasciatus]